MQTVSMAKSTHCSNNPNLSIIRLKKVHSTRSYALLISSLTTICPVRTCLLFHIQCNISNATVVLSVISLLGTKALCESEITLGRIVFNLFANTLDTILETTLLRMIGRNSVICWGSFTLGTSTM